MGLQDFIDKYVFPASEGAISPPNEGYVPSFEGSGYEIHPTEGTVRMTPSDPGNVGPGAEPTPLLSKKMAKEIQPYHKSLAELASTFGEDPSKGGHLILPGSRELHEALGTTGKAAGLTTGLYNIPVVGSLLRAASPDAQFVMQKQDAVNKLYGSLVQAKLDQAASRFSAPKTMGDVQAAGLGGIIKPLNSQLYSPGPYQDGLGSTPPTNPNAVLQPWQQDMAMQGLRGMTAGHLMQTQDGIVPTSYATAQEKMIDPGVVSWMNQVSAATPGQAIAAPPRNIPATIANQVISQIGQTARQSQQVPNLNNRLESLTALASSQKYGAPMTFTQLAQKDPELAGQLRQRAEIDEQKDIYSFQQGEMLKRQLQGAAPIAAMQETARKEAERDQPVQDPQLWRDPETAKAASSAMTTRQAQTKGYVKLRPDQLEVMNQSEVIDKGLQEVKKIVEKKFRPPSGTPIGEFLGAMIQTGKLAALRASGDPDIMKMDSIITRLTAPLVKSQGDTANIAVAERDMFARSLVNNQASASAILANLDNVIQATRSVRQKMGFVDPDAMKSALVAAGNSEAKADKIVKQRFTEESQSPTDQLRSRYQMLRSKGMSIEQIKADKEIQRLDALASKKK